MVGGERERKSRKGKGEKKKIQIFPQEEIWEEKRVTRQGKERMQEEELWEERKEEEKEGRNDEEANSEEATRYWRMGVRHKTKK